MVFLRGEEVWAVFRQDVRRAPFVVCFGEEEVCGQMLDKMCGGPYLWFDFGKRCVSRFPTRCLRGPMCGVSREKDV